MPREGVFQTKFREDLEYLYPGCIVCKLDSSYRQGVPDLVMFWNDCWATFEVKASATARIQPNQEHFVHKMNDMSFSAFVHPGNVAEVLNDLQRAFEDKGATFLS